jgi:hypothetical protein
MDSAFKKIYDELTGEPQVSYERFHQLLKELKHMGDVSDDLLEGIREQFRNESWGGLVRLICAIHSSPSSKFVPLLCDLLDNHKDREIAEQIIDTLDEICDERSIPAFYPIDRLLSARR